MTRKEYLTQALLLDLRIDAKMEDVLRLRSRLEAGRTMSVTGMPRGSGAADWTDTIIKVIGLENELNADIDKLVDLKREIARRIEDVEDVRERTVLQLRYLSGWDWARIAEKMHYGRTQMWEIHTRALGKIDFSGCPDVS